VLLVTSCAIFESPPVPSVTNSDRDGLYALAAWSLDGRIGIRSRHDSLQASLLWQHQGEMEKLRIAGPFGQGAVSIEYSEKFIRILHADGNIEESNRPEDLLNSLLGVSLPVSAMRYWVLGISYPFAQAVEEFDEGGKLKTLKQLGWEINYKRFSLVENWVLPQKLEANNGNNRVKLFVDEWSIVKP